MCNWLNSLARDRRGVTAIEFAFVVPILLVLFIGLTELGRAHCQAAAVEKSLRAGALFAARNPLPLNSATQTLVQNLVKTGNLQGTQPYVVPGWSDGAASLKIDPLTYTVGGKTLQMVRLTASVPYVPLVPGFSFVWGLNNYTMKFSHEQAFIGD